MKIHKKQKNRGQLIKNLKEEPACTAKSGFSLRRSIVVRTTQGHTLRKAPYCDFERLQDEQRPCFYFTLRWFINGLYLE